MSENPPLDRRSFLKQTGALGLGLAGLGALAGCPRHSAPSRTAEAPPTPAPTPPSASGRESLVAHVTHAGVQPSPGQLSHDVVLQMLDKGIRDVTGEQSADAAWKSLFASDDVVAIKVNTISRNVFTQPALALAVAQRLTEVGVPPGSIIIWDRTNGELIADGYEPQTAAGKVQVRGVEGDWEGEPTRIGSFNGRLAKIITQQCSALINMPCLKNHGGAVVTLALKNHYGSHHNPGDHHGNECDPYVADLNAIDAIKNKTRLIVCDATRGCANGGPGADDPRYVWTPNAILMAQDPVAHDAFGAKLLDEKRRSFGLPGIQPKHLVTAAARGLGTNDLAQVNVIESNLA